MGSARGCSLIPHLNRVNPDAFDSEGFRAKTQAEDFVRDALSWNQSKFFGHCNG